MSNVEEDSVTLLQERGVIAVGIGVFCLKGLGTGYCVSTVLVYPFHFLYEVLGASVGYGGVGFR